MAALLSNHQHLPVELIDFVVENATQDADGVHEFLAAVEEKSGEKWERPLSFPSAFLLGVGAAIRLSIWEASGFFPHKSIGLLGAHETLRQVAHSCQHLPPSERDTYVMDVCLKVFTIAIEKFAWAGPTALGGEVLLVAIEEDEDAIISAIAEIAWKHRHKETENGETHNIS